MDIAKRIAKTLTSWMAASQDLNTIKKVSAKSGVGFGTVQRAKNGDGNITVKNLALIAAVFSRPIEDLLGMPRMNTDELPTSLSATIVPMFASEPAALPYRLQALVDVARTMNDDGQMVLLGRAQELALKYRRAQPNHAG